MRCAIYTRVSTHEQARLEYSSLDTQAEICRSYVEVHREDRLQGLAHATPHPRWLT